MSPCPRAAAPARTLHAWARISALTWALAWSGWSAASEEPPPIPATIPAVMTRCAAVSVTHLRSLLALESPRPIALTVHDVPPDDWAAPPPPPAPPQLALAIDCPEPGIARLTLTPPIDAPPLQRALPLPDQPELAARLLALALVELIETSGYLRAPPPPPPDLRAVSLTTGHRALIATSSQRARALSAAARALSVAAPPKDPAPLPHDAPTRWLGLGAAFGGADGVWAGGAGLWWAHHPRPWWLWSVSAQSLWSSQPTTRGDVRLLRLSAALGVGLRHGWGAWSVAASAQWHLGAVWFDPSDLDAADLDTRPLWLRWQGAGLLLCADYALSDHLRAHAALDLGLTTEPAAGRVSGQRQAAADDGWLTLSLGVAWGW